MIKKAFDAVLGVEIFYDRSVKWSDRIKITSTLRFYILEKVFIRKKMCKKTLTKFFTL